MLDVFPKGFVIRSVTLTASSLVLIALTVGCSGSTPDVATTATSTRPAPVPEPFYGKSNAKVVAQVKAEVKAASSVHVAVWIKPKGKNKRLRANLKMTRAGRCVGTVVIAGSTVSFRRPGRTLYLKADRNFWSGFPDTADVMANRWIKIPKGWSKETDTYIAMTRPVYWIQELMAMGPVEVEDLTRETGILRGGTQTTALSDWAQDLPGATAYYVSSVGPAYPYEFKFGPPDWEWREFRGWNSTAVNVVAPERALDLNSL